jgi:mannan endo-1,4-beta-mannosidase
MRKRVIGLTIAALGASMAVTVSPAQAASGIHVSGSNIVEGNGSNFIMRGTSHAHTWYPSQTQSFAGIKSLGGNTVRVVLSAGRWGTSNGASDVANVISLCKANKLICVLEYHDTTGYGEQSGATTLSSAVGYWTGLKSVLQGQEDYVVINIGNEPYGNNNPGDWTSATTSAVKAMRSAGFTHALMVDAPNWGQDWSFTMRDNASTVAAADSLKNTIFSIHMYGVFDTASEVTSYISAFKSKGLPLVVGEFGDMHSDGNPDEDTIMSTAVSQGIGYLGWSWSGNGSGVEYLDQVNSFDTSSLTSWGKRLFQGSNGIKSTAKEASIYSGVTSTTTTTRSSSTTTSSPPVSTTTTTSTSGGGGTASNGYPYCVYGSSSDPDGDGWGWENSASCVVKGSSADPGPATSTTTTKPSTTTTSTTTTTKPTTTTGQPSTTSTTASTTTGGGQSGGCAVKYTVASQWDGGFVANLDITNGGSSSISGWTLGFGLPSGQVITSGWNATYSQSGSSVTVKDAGYNSVINAGQTVSVGFQGTFSGSNGLPTSFTLNGATCNGANPDSTTTTKPTTTSSTTKSSSTTSTTTTKPSSTTSTTTTTSTSQPPVQGVHGFATVNGSTTGGSGGSSTTVSSLSALQSAVSGSSAKVVKVNGNFSCSDDVLVGSNTTVIGVGSSSGLTGCGLNMKAVSNVLIQNMKIGKVKASNGNGDAIHIDKAAHHIWIDHNDLSGDRTAGKDDYDGLVDITHGADYITVSWNYIHDHWKGSLVGHSDSNSSEDTGKLHITYDHNYFYNINSRGPSLRFGTGHAYNNLYQTMSTAVHSRMGAQMLVQNNVFSGVTTPIQTNVDSDVDGYVNQSGNDFGSGTNKISRTGSFTSPPYSYSLDGTSSVASIVKSGAGTGRVG